MVVSRFDKAIALIDEENSKDAHKDYVQGQEFPKELLYSRRISKKLLEFKPNASEALQIAAHAHHICRWKIPRDAYPMGRVGYLMWRETLKKMHAKLTSEILKGLDYDSEFIDRVSLLILKKKIKKDEESQVIEDVICLVFLEHYYEDFAAKHDDEKVVDILRKTWVKMSDRGQELALKIQYPPKLLALIKKASI
ncbi:DUF4202 domain-containing protein [Flavobacteriaceae bacterium LMO-SS05]